ncbi:hypothetical protein EXIGLDRAFT_693489 [Exidia glandulosa HHB12029]|uniref:HD domain-containing protein n=1 Tax=Exidia glandulosa HHB12029 TaxID=1314781 RepID=A0A165HBK0_EXIGL|nr:hypothetical protein EXIGLDRAFT_693489 [Exidia glandulosa HHB12029]
MGQYGPSSDNFLPYRQIVGGKKTFCLDQDSTHENASVSVIRRSPYSSATSYNPTHVPRELIIAIETSQYSLSALQRVTPDITKDFVRKWWFIINSAYDHEHQRHYHCMAHIEAMWGSYKRWKDAIPPLSEEEEATLLCAILFHDIVYDPKASGGVSERESAAKWEEFAKEGNLDPPPPLYPVTPDGGLP